MNRSVTRKLSSDEEPNEKPMALSASESISFVWDLTKEVFSLTKKYDVESRLQRNVVNITQPNEANAEKVYKALVKFGTPLQDITICREQV
ncbi:MAG: hypothetical protein ACMUIP_15720 [bacterium]